MNNNLNIIEAYLKEFGQMIILLIGMPTSNKSNIAKELKSDIEPKFTLININDYFEQKFINQEAKNINFKLYDHPDNINYSKLFDDINKVKSTGVILYGNSIDPNKIKDIKIDFSYFFDIKPIFLKNNLIKIKKLPFSTPSEEQPQNNNLTNDNALHRNKYHNVEKSLSNTESKTDDIESKTNDTESKTNDTESKTNDTTDDSSSTDDDDAENDTTASDTTNDDTVSNNEVTNTANESNLKNDDDEIINSKLEIYIKDILMPMYDNIKKNIKFNKFYNIKEDTKFSDIYDNLFDNLMLLIKKKLNQPVEEKSKSSEVHLDRNKNKFKKWNKFRK
jgi:hypothetical protein